MLSTIKDIGKLVADTQAANTIEENIEGKILFVNLDTVKLEYTGIEILEYTGIEIEDFDSDKRDYYLYKAGASKGNAPAPICPITEVEKTYKKIESWLKQCNQKIESWLKQCNQKIESWLKQCNQTKDPLINHAVGILSQKNFYALYLQMSLILYLQMSLINHAVGILSQRREDITSVLDKKIKDLPKKKGEGRFLSLKINKKYLGEYDILKNCLINLSEEKLKRSAGSGVCSLCGLSDKEVSGKTNVFKFYTIDKPGFITGGFKEALAWKNFPVCGECRALLENGKEFLKKKLNFKFYGLNYYLIPRLLIGSKEIWEEILNIMSETPKTISPEEKIKKRITNDENEILEYLSEKKDVLTLNFLFLKEEQSAERILLLIEDVFPSRIRKIFDAKNEVDELFNKNSDEKFTFGTIRTFFSKSSEGKSENDLDKYFLDIIDSVFKGKRIDFNLLVKFYMATIRREVINEGYFTFRVKDALMNIKFFENLGIITFEEVENMEESRLNSIFNRFGKSLKTPAKKGIFLLGVLTQWLLNKQWAERNARPFMKKLKGLRMDEKDIKALLPEVQNKLEEYDSFDQGKRLIASEASTYLLEAGDNWKMSVDEINFYFACGMNIAEDVSDIVYPNNGKKEKEE
ncbi:TIGR02556 family CRISPR-associated protein [Thermospira aquatica]|uniref:TIGR02556 family CRISPR-associated protein n=1 Tax=Thermospira aquatica TaxID=2828656 RepID=A0AAX3BFX3_9SPIR|nr:TIGR02556 family CRISPR-associated protein [Thermospira aquatica]URA11175.1 TIGR02556 family CRISPR-associated protein [Thermospira aquatica]